MKNFNSLLFACVVGSIIIGVGIIYAVFNFINLESIRATPKILTYCVDLLFLAVVTFLMINRSKAV